jgi:hypothetical protein
VAGVKEKPSVGIPDHNIRIELTRLGFNKLGLLALTRTRRVANQ